MGDSYRQDDSADELLLYKDTLRKLVEAAKDKEWDEQHCGVDGIVPYCGSCGGMRHNGHYPNCPYAAAIAEAERLLESEGK